MRVEIEAPEEFTGVLMGDLTGRRGRVQGMESGRGTTVIRAEVPMSEMLTYGASLTAMTQGRGSFRLEMARYDAVPGGSGKGYRLGPQACAGRRRILRVKSPPPQSGRGEIVRLNALSDIRYFWLPVTVKAPKQRLAGNLSYDPNGSRL